jgi:hypothetical protein
MIGPYNGPAAWQRWMPLETRHCVCLLLLTVGQIAHKIFINATLMVICTD